MLQVIDHPWFQQNLPPGMLQCNSMVSVPHPSVLSASCHPRRDLLALAQAGRGVLAAVRVALGSVPTTRPGELCCPLELTASEGWRLTDVMRHPQLLSEPPGAGLQSEEEIGTIAKEARIPVMTNQADDIDDLAGALRSQAGLAPAGPVTHAVRVRHQCHSPFMPATYKAKAGVSESDAVAVVDTTCASVVSVHSMLLMPR